MKGIFVFIFVSAATAVGCSSIVERADYDMAYNVASHAQNNKFIFSNQCSESVWPGFKLDHVQLIAADRQEAYWFDRQKNELVKLQKSELPEAVWGGQYYGFSFRGMPAMSVNSSFRRKSSESLLKLFIHESFHHYFQNKVFKDTGNAVAPKFPYEVEPRLARYKLLRSLIQYLVTSDQKNLGRAKYWYERWSSTAPEEAKNYHDIIEGTARYVDEILPRLDSKNCFTQKNLEESILKWGEELDHLNTNMRFEGLNTSSYEVGGAALASIVLKSHSTSRLNEVQGGKVRMFDALFADVDLIEDKATGNELRGMQYLIGQQNKILGASINDELALIDTKSYKLVGFNQAHAVSNYVSSDFIQIGSWKMSTVLIDPLQIKSPNQAFVLPAGTLIADDSNLKCGRFAEQIVVPNSAFRSADTFEFAGQILKYDPKTNCLL